MRKRYTVTLPETERTYLKGLIAAGTESVHKLIHARILLKADQGPEGPGWVDGAIAEAVEVSQPFRLLPRAIRGTITRIVKKMRVSRKTLACASMMGTPTSYP